MLSFFLRKNVFYKRWWISQYVVYQPTFDALDLEIDQGTYYVFSWKSKWVYTSRLKPLHTASLYSINPSGYRMGIKFDKDLLAIKRNNYLTKIANVHIVYDLHIWPK